MACGKTKANELTINYSDFIPSNLSFGELDESKGKGKILRAFPQYNHPKHGKLSMFFIQMPWIKITEYGLPRKEWFTEKDDNRRYDLKIPLDESNPSIKCFTDMLKKIDKQLSTSDFKTIMFKNKASKYNYHPIFREIKEDTENDNSDNEEKTKSIKQPYMVIKIDYEDIDNIKHIKSMIFKSKMEGNERHRELVTDIVTIDDFAKYITFMSDIHPIIKPVKLWAQHSNKKDPMYGLIFKLAKTEVEVQPISIPKTTVKDYNIEDSFVSENIVNATSSNATSSNATSSNATSSNAVASNAVASNAVASNAVASNAVASNAVASNITSNQDSDEEDDSTDNDD